MTAETSTRAPTEKTIAAYTREADLYAELTASADFAWWHAHVRALRAPPGRLLDLGSGVGRDVRAFTALGYEAQGVEGCAALARGTNAHITNLLDLALTREWDVVTANAVLHHLPAPALSDLLTCVRGGLLPGGVFAAVVPEGADEEGWARGRFVRHLRAQTWRGVLGDFADVRVHAREHWLVISARVAA